MKVALIGASGGIGQPLSLLLKMNPLIKELALYDLKTAKPPSAGVAADVSHINSPAKVTGYAGDEDLPKCLANSNVVVITAGIPRQPGMTRDDLLKTNAKIVKGVAEACAKHCPKAINLIITNPVNSTVPVACEVYKKANVFDKRKVIGVTTLDIIRASSFVAQKTGMNPNEVKVPVIGGHAGETILPLLSQVSPKLAKPFTQEEIAALDKHIQDAGTEVVEAKAGAGSATLSMAFAASRFVDSVVKGLNGTKVVECCYVNTNGDEYLASEVELGANGVEKILEATHLSDYEKQRLTQAKAKLVGDIKAGIDYIKAPPV